MFNGSNETVPTAEREAAAHCSTAVRCAIEDHSVDKIIERLGPFPRDSLCAMVGYGLSDGEIGRYYQIPSQTIQDLRNAFGINHGY